MTSEPIVKTQYPLPPRIPRWLGWTHVLLLPVTTLWLTCWAFPFLLCYLLWIFAIPLAAVLFVFSASVAYSLLKDREGAEKRAATVANLCAIPAMIAFIINSFVSSQPRAMFCLASAVWYCVMPFFLPSPGLARPSSNPPEGGSQPGTPLP